MAACRLHWRAVVQDAAWQEQTGWTLCLLYISAVLWKVLGEALRKGGQRTSRATLNKDYK